jgi:hypothetical protein
MNGISRSWISYGKRLPYWSLTYNYFALVIKHKGSRCGRAVKWQRLIRHRGALFRCNRGHSWM